MKTIERILALGFIALILCLTSVSLKAQDVIYSSSVTYGSYDLKKITINGTNESFNTINTEVKSAGIAAYGNFIFALSYGDQGESLGKGKVRIKSYNKTTGTYTGYATDVDVNGNGNGGSNDDDLGFIRFGSDKNGLGFILAKKLEGNTMYLDRVTLNGTTGEITNATEISNNVTTSDNSNNTFVNGDLAFTGDGTLFVLANNGSGTTKIYTLDVYNSTVLQKKWDVKRADGSSFTNQVSGIAFASDGSLYVSSSGGLFYLDHNSTNFSGNGTVKCTEINDTNGIADLASFYWPEATRLPVRFSNFKVTRIK